MKSLAIAALALACVSAGVAAQQQAKTVATAQGVVIQMTHRDLPSGKPTPSGTIYIQGGMMREDEMDERGHINSFSIVRDGAIWDVDTQARTYKKIDKASMQQAMAQVNAMMEGMKAQMANMPPARRAMMQQMIDRFQGNAATAATPPVTYVDGGKDETSGSYTCHIWEMRVGDKVEMQYCVVPWSSVPGGDQAEAAWTQMSAMMKDMMSTVTFPGIAKMMNERAKAFSDPHGFPVLTREMENGQPLNEDAVTSIQKQSISADRFEIPKGFKEEPLTNGMSPMGGMGGPGGH